MKKGVIVFLVVLLLSVSLVSAFPLPNLLKEILDGSVFKTEIVDESIFSRARLAPSSGTIYYVDDTGCSDSYPGTESQPWCTLAKAASTLQAGDTVLVQDGTYVVSQINPTNSGTLGNQITFKANGDNVIIDGSNTHAFWLRNRNYITLDGFEFINSDACVLVYPSSSTMKGITLRNFYSDGGCRIGIYTSNFDYGLEDYLVENIHFKSAGGVGMNGANGGILRNCILDCTATGGSGGCNTGVNNGNNILIENNQFLFVNEHTINIGHSDPAKGCDNVVVRNNIFYRIHDVKIDAGNTNVDVLHNTFVLEKEAGWSSINNPEVYPSEDITIKDNLFVQTGWVGVPLSRLTESDYNFWTASWPPGSTGSGIYGNPLLEDWQAENGYVHDMNSYQDLNLDVYDIFVDPDNLDFTPRSESWLCQTGNEGSDGETIGALSCEGGPDPGGDIIYISQSNYVPEMSLDQPGATYILTEDISSNSGGFWINADDITLDGDGHKLSYNPSGTRHGIFLWGHEGVTIKNLEIEKLGEGINIHCSGSNNNHIVNNILTSQDVVEASFSLSGCDNNLIEGNYVEGGWTMGGSSYNTIKNNYHIDSNYPPPGSSGNWCYLSGESTYNTFTNNTYTLLDSGYQILQIADAHYNSFFNNSWTMTKESYGFGFMFHIRQRSSFSLFEDNIINFTNGYHAVALTQGSYAPTHDNTFINNKIYGGQKTITLWDGTYNNYFEGNLIIGTNGPGVGWSDDVPDSGDDNSFVGNTIVSETGPAFDASLHSNQVDQLFRDNIFSSKNDYSLELANSYTNFDSDYNLFFREQTGPFVKYGGTGYSDLSAYQSASGKDLHSLNLNPLLDENYVPYESSPVCGSASDGGDIGAFSCGGTQQDPCTLTNAHWSETNVEEGAVVELIVEGTNCYGKEINFSVYEQDDINQDDFIVEIIDNYYRTTWTAVWQLDEWGTDPEYYFNAYPIENPSSIVTSDLLFVTQAAQPECDGTDTSCGIYPDCVNCNTDDDCYLISYRDYYCSGTSCLYNEDDCTDCSCTCGGYNIPESIENENCEDEIDNDCDGVIDEDELACQTVGGGCEPSLPEGFGSTTSGGAGQEVYHVTSLGDSGSGTLRDALSSSNRYIVFDVEGIITLSSSIVIDSSKHHITIDGSSSPGAGITIKASSTGVSSLIVQGHDIIINNIRFREPSYDALRIYGTGAYNILIDHCSLTGASDGNLDITNGAHDVTVQWSIMGDNVKNQLVRYNPKDLSLHHNIYINSQTRSPLLDTDSSGVFDFVNNIVFDWISSGTEIDGYSNGNLIGNYWLPGSNTPASKYKRAILIGNGYGEEYYGQFYREDNIIPSETEYYLTGFTTDVEFSAPHVTTLPVELAFEVVLDVAGACPRDLIDIEYVSAIPVGEPQDCVDTDGDGYNQSGSGCGVLDCDDNDGNIWQLLTGYPDNDQDGYYSEISEQVCSGDTLPAGYSPTQGNDCNDNTHRVNPDMTELCSNDIDEDCDNLIDCDDPECSSDPDCIQEFIYSYIELEQGEIITPFRFGINSPSFSGTGYVYPDVGQGKDDTDLTPKVSINVNIPETKNYYLWLRMYGVDRSRDALYIGFDGNYDRVYPVGWGDYEWVRVEVTHYSENYEHYLTSGNHVINVDYGEPLARADVVLVTDDVDFVPSGIPNPPQGECSSNSDCDDDLYCNGQETCVSGSCQSGTPVDCSENDLSVIETCDNSPDDNSFTLDYFAGFTSSCDEAIDSCTVGTVDLTHACDIENCGTGCETDEDCAGYCVNCVCVEGLQNFTLTLLRGENFISFPLLDQEGTVEEAFSEVFDNLIRVYYYDPVDGWKVYHKNNPRKTTLTTVQPKRGYVVKMSSNVDLLTLGTGTLELISLEPGWNMIGISGIEPILVEDALAQVDYAEVYVYGDRKYQNIGDPVVEYLSPGVGYWVYVGEQGGLFAPPDTFLGRIINIWNSWLR